MHLDARSYAWDAGRPPAEWLERVNRHALLARLMSATVHDVNNLLQVVSGAAEVLAMDPTPEAVTRRTTSIVAQAGQATGALQALAAFARNPDSSGGHGDRVRPRAIADQAVALHLHALRKARIAVTVEGAEVDCAGSAGRVLQVLLNLIVNAEQVLAGRTGAALAVRVTATAEAVLVAVEDNGPGLASDQAATIFTWPPAAAPMHGRLGIGLIVAHGLAAANGGALTCDRLPHGGATFRLVLPR